MNRPGSILAENPAGRADIAALRVTELLARRMNAGQLWDNGLGAIAEEFIARTVPPVSPLDMLERVGLLPPDRRKQIRGRRVR